MYKTLVSLLMIPSMAGMLLAAPAAASDSLLDALRARYSVSRIDVQSESSEGRVISWP